jgi:hypothetical protein
MKMLEIPIGKALVAVEVKNSSCIECDVLKLWNKPCHSFICFSSERKDGKNVIFKLVSWIPMEDRKHD